MNRQDLHFPEKHQPLREDIHALGGVLGELLREQGGESLYELVEGDRRMAIASHGGAEAELEHLAQRVRGRSPQLATGLLRAFSGWFYLVNLAEKVHRVRRRRQYFVDASGRAQPGGMGEALAEIKAQGLGLEEVLALLRQLSLQPVFVPHPMESTRRTLLRRQQRIADLLLARDNPQLAPQERRSLLERVRGELSVDWQTAEHPRERLTIADEREHAIFYLAEVMYRIVPAFYWELAEGLGQLYGVEPASIELPSLLRFGTWAGGDMVGSQDVHAKSIRETLARHQQVIVNNYHGDCERLAEYLSQSASRVPFAPALLARMAEYRMLLPGTQGRSPARHDQMPYRVFLGQVAERLRRTFQGSPNGYEGVGQFRADILLVADSLREHRGVNAGFLKARRLLARIDAFGFHLATLDLRQHASVHHEVLAQGLDEPGWTALPAAERYRRLLDLLERDRGPTGAFNALGKRTLAVFDALLQGRNRYGDDAVGLYVVSDARGADDVLAPLLLARWAEARDRSSGEAIIDVAPQFDSVDALNGCGAVMRQLLGDNVYRRHLESRGRQQCVLIGYSDSGQEGGLVASRLAAYQAQRSLSRALRGAREQHVLVHARGGSIPRGGGRIDELLRSAPAESISGVLRYTEQGESVSQNYGLTQNAMRTLERAFHTLSLSSLAVRRGVAVQESSAFAACVQRVADRSRERWRALVHEDPRCMAYFRAATPIDVIERMQIGSEAIDAHGSGEGVSAAAWVFAWSQSRLLLPGWYGAGAALAAEAEQSGIDLLQRAWRGWPFFRQLIDDLEAMLARADLRIARCYDRLAPEELRALWPELESEYAEACRQVLAIKQSPALLDTDRTLQRGIALRAPYVDPMNLMQVDMLARWRAGRCRDRSLFEALVASVGGVARGLQTWG